MESTLSSLGLLVDDELSNAAEVLFCPSNFDIDSLSEIVLFESDEVRVTISFTATRKDGSLPAYSFEFESDCQLSFNKDASP